MTIQFCRKLFHRFAMQAAWIMTPLAMTAATAATAATAQTPPPPSDAPPRLERLEEGAPAGTPQPSNSGKGVTERSTGTNGEIEVNTGASTYYVRPNNQLGNAQPGDQQSSGNRAAQFRVKQFDLGQKKVIAPGETSSTLEEPVPPPASPTRK